MTTPQMTLTTLGKQKLDEYLSEEPSDTHVRILVEDDGKFGLSLDSTEKGDFVFELEEILFCVEEPHKETLTNLKIDYLDQGASSGFSLTGGKPPLPRVVLRAENTPNPDARKYVLAFSLGEGNTTYTQEGVTGEEDAEVPEVFAQVLALEGVESVFVLKTFVTITRTQGGGAGLSADWNTFDDRARELLSKLERPKLSAGKSYGDGDSLFERIGRFVISDVAPFLQQDGGDIELVKVDDEGKVHVRLVGACGTCPSSVMTLQGGVERRLKGEFPEVTGLVLADTGAVV